MILWWQGNSKNSEENLRDLAYLRRGKVFLGKIKDSCCKPTTVIDI